MQIKTIMLELLWWSRGCLHTPNAVGLGSIPGQGTRSHMLHGGLPTKTCHRQILKKTTTLPNATTWTMREIMLLVKESSHKRPHMIPFAWNFQKRPIFRDRTWISGHRCGLEELGFPKWGIAANSYSISFGGDKNVKLTVVWLHNSMNTLKNNEWYSFPFLFSFSHAAWFVWS